MPPEYVTRDECKDTSGRILSLLQEINARLYKDNGTKSHQTLINEQGVAITELAKAMTSYKETVIDHDRLLVGYKTVSLLGLWVLRIAGGACVLGLITLIALAIKHALISEAVKQMFGAS